VNARFEVRTGDDMRDLGEKLAAQLQRGDLVLLTGPLGAGKTTLAQGIGAGLGVRGPIASPTFIIARAHPSEVGGPDLIHVDAYRLASLDELDHLDLDSSLDEAVTLVEWGEGRAETLADDRLHVVIDRERGGDFDADAPGSGVRTVTITGHGPRWATVQPVPGPWGATA
jgi:tRNA threonylcarbamoyladenosine biosynthesis protein TsaE